MCFLCTCEWKSIGFPEFKNPGLHSSKQIYPSPLIKKQFELLLFYAHFDCHFPLQFRKTIGSLSEAGNQIVDVLRQKKKEEEEHASN